MVLIPLVSRATRTRRTGGSAANSAAVIGTLRPGASSDVAILKLSDGACEFRDPDGNSVIDKPRLVTHLTLKDGRVLYERLAD